MTSNSWAIVSITLVYAASDTTPSCLSLSHSRAADAHRYRTISR